MLVDVMLGSLARWLRILGFDTDYDNRIEDDEIARRCFDEQRLLLTQDRRLTQRRLLRNRCLLVESRRLPDQLREALEFLNSPPQLDRILSRCLICNSPIIVLGKEEARRQVPEYVFQTQNRFKYCPQCRRVYWGGTHRGRILKKLASWGFLSSNESDGGRDQESGKG